MLYACDPQLVVEYAHQDLTAPKLRWWGHYPKILVGSQLYGLADWEALKQQCGVTHCVNTAVECDDSFIGGAERLQVPIVDDGGPIPYDLLEAAADFAVAPLACDGAIYCHCLHGGSRSPAFAYAIMRRRYNWTPSRALESINLGYPHGDGYYYGYHPRHRGYLNSIDAWIASK